jgi:type II secretory ATPase GspE/PulE/Tfp pilus assembly ATPase PilB-like protein
MGNDGTSCSIARAARVDDALRFLSRSALGGRPSRPLDSKVDERIESARLNSSITSFQKRAQLGELLVSEGLLSPTELDAALCYCQERGVKLGQALVALHLVSQADLARVLRLQGKVYSVHLTPDIVDVNVARLLGADISRRLQSLAINCIAGAYTVVMEDPSDPNTVDAISMQLHGPVFPVHAAPELIDECIDHVFGRRQELAVGDTLDGPASSPIEAELRLSRETDGVDDPEQTAVNLVRAVLEEACTSQASDIHFEPRANGFLVRYRIDGVLSDRIVLPANWAFPMVEHLKSLAGLQGTSTRPQKGSAEAEVHGDPIELLIATAPTVRGQCATVRVRARSKSLVELSQLDLEPDVLTELTRMVEGSGLVLIAGLEGSGRTTLAYALLQRVAPGRKIATIESSVARNLEGGIQTRECDADSWADGVRALLDHDPDVLYLGEIPDYATGRAAAQAALAGRLVIARVAAGGAAEATLRLSELGVEPWLVASTLRGSIAQRLVRRLCSHCARQIEPPRAILDGLPPAAAEGPHFEGHGCERCRMRGYSGRIPLHEVLPVDGRVAALIRGGTDARALRGVTSISFFADGLKKARAGQVNLSEICRAIVRPGA